MARRIKREKIESEYECSSEAAESSEETAEDTSLDEEYDYEPEEEEDEEIRRAKTTGKRLVRGQERKKYVRKSEDGHHFEIVRLRQEDNQYDGTTVRQTQAIEYISGILKSRNEFYVELWRDMSQIFLNCKFNKADWSCPAQLSRSIEKWLNKVSISFRIESTGVSPANFSARQKPLAEKPRGRPRKSADQLKFPRKSSAASSTLYITRTMTNGECHRRNNCLESNNRAEHGTVPSTSAASNGDTDGNVVDSSRLETVPIFTARRFTYSAKGLINAGGVEGSIRLASISKQLIRFLCTPKLEEGQPNLLNYSAMDVVPRLTNTFFASLQEERSKPFTAMQALFCGGPISAIAACPRRSSLGEEVFAVSTFADEEMLSFNSKEAHVQFWTYPSDLSYPAKLRFILEIPDVSAVLSMRWCPCFTNDYYGNATPPTTPKATTKNSRTSKTKVEERNLLNFEKTKDILGYLAVGTNTGKVLIYCIPRELESITELSWKTVRESAAAKKRKSTSDSSEAQDSNKPLVVTCKPKFCLNHPITAIRIDESTQDISFNKQPKKSTKVKEASATVTRYLQTMENTTEVVKELDDFPIINLSWSPFCNARMIAGVSASGRVLVWDLEAKAPLDQPIVLYSPAWSSPPITVSWFTRNDVAITFRAKNVAVYNIDKEMCMMKDETPRTAGLLATSCPSVFTGFFTTDTSFLALHEIYYACSVYIDFEDDNLKKAFVLPLPNCHQIQSMGIDVCEMSGSVMTCGADGRLVASVNGKVHPRSERNLKLFFSSSRPIMHITSRRKTTSMKNGSIALEPVATASLPRTVRKRKSKGGATTSGRYDILRTIREMKTELMLRDDDSSPRASTGLDEITEIEEGGGSSSSQLSEKLCFTHDDCCESKVLEISVGDAAMCEQKTMRQMNTRIPDANLDRRLESLKFVECSRLTPGLVISGGEAGLVFLTFSNL